MQLRNIQPENAQPLRWGQARRTAARSRLLAAAVAGVAFLTLVSGCAARRPEREVNLPTTPVISIRPLWAVATSTYVRVSAEPLNSSFITGHLRVGDIAAIKSISTGVHNFRGSPGRWYEIESGGLSGWASGEFFEFFESESRARNAANLLLSAGNRSAPQTDRSGEP